MFTKNLYNVDIASQGETLKKVALLIKKGVKSAKIGKTVIEY